jgi:hypothetical protein
MLTAVLSRAEVEHESSPGTHYEGIPPRLSRGCLFNFELRRSTRASLIYFERLFVVAAASSPRITRTQRALRKSSAFTVGHIWFLKRKRMQLPTALLLYHCPRSLSLGFLKAPSKWAPMNKEYYTSRSAEAAVSHTYLIPTDSAP